MRKKKKKKKKKMRFWFLAGALALLLTSSAPAQDIFEIENQFYSTKEISKSIEFGQRRTLLIRSAESLRGSISLKAGDHKDITISYRKQARAVSRSQATDYIDLISVVTKAPPDMIVLFLKAPNPSPWNSETETGQVEIDIFLPHDFTVEIEATYFSVSSEGGLKALLDANSFGSFDIDGITEELILGTKNQRITLNNISGKINVSTTNARLRASRIVSPADAAVFRNEGGEIDIDGFVGQLNSRNKFGSITITDFQLFGDGNIIRSTSGRVEVALIGANEGQLVINNRYSDIHLSFPDTLSVYLSLSVDEEGTIEVEGFEFKTDLVETDRLNLIAGDGVIEIVSSIRGKGDIFVNGFKGADN